jgi:hypothetical protein
VSERLFAYGTLRQEPRWSSYTEKGDWREFNACRSFIHAASFHSQARSQTREDVRGGVSQENAKGSPFSP